MLLNKKKLRNLSVISLTIFLSSSFLIIFTYWLLSDIPLIYSLLENYLNSGNSFFIPGVPNINILWFLPKEFQIIQLTVGQCIDIITVLNLTCYFESLIYHYIKWTLLNKNSQVFLYLDSFYLDSKNEHSEMCEEFELIQDLKDGHFREYLHVSSLSYKLVGRNDHIYGHFEKKKYRSYSDQKRIASGPFKSTFNNYLNHLLVFNYHSIFDYFWTFCTKIHYSLLDINSLTDFTEQRGGKAMIKINLMAFFKIFAINKFEINSLLNKGI